MIKKKQTEYIVLKCLLLAQIVAYMTATLITYNAAHDNVDNANGIAALLPLGVFYLLMAINLFLSIICGLKYKKIDIAVIILILINITFAAMDYSIVNWISL